MFFRILSRRYNSNQIEILIHLLILGNILCGLFRLFLSYLTTMSVLVCKTYSVSGFGFRRIFLPQWMLAAWVVWAWRSCKLALRTKGIIWWIIGGFPPISHPNGWSYSMGLLGIYQPFLGTPSFLGGGFKDLLFFIPKIGEDEPMLTKIFQMGWFNHQLDNTGCLPAICGLSSDFGATDERFFSCVVRIC